MRIFKEFLGCIRSEKGSVFVLVALSSMMLIASTGVAVDMARAQILEAKIQTALDAAGLAAGATANTIDVQTQAQKYFAANFPTGYLGSGTVTVTATMSADESTVSLSANTSQATTFMKAIGVNSVNVAANTQITRANDGLELVLVLDNTGSMQDAVDPSDSSTSKMQALQNAINSTGGLLDILYGTSDTIANMWIGVVPFGDMVNLGSAHSSWLDSSADAALDYGPAINGSCPQFSGTNGQYTTGPNRCYYTIKTTNPQPNYGMTNWAGCVTARSATKASSNEPSLTLDSSDDVPSSSVSGTYFPAFYYPTTDTSASTSNTCTSGSNPWTCNRTSGSNTITVYNSVTSTQGGNTNCLAASIMGMTASKTNVSNEVNTMSAGGSTMINLGMSWGFRMLSPNWKGIWGGEMNNTGNPTFPVLPLQYHTALMNKVLILMTDGMNNTSSNAGYSGQSTPSDAKLDTNTESICDTLKSNGVIIYTIGFGTTDDDDPSNPTSVDGPLLKYCATQYYSGDVSHYFLAPTNAQLATAFQQIGNSLANLRVSQ